MGRNTRKNQSQDKVNDSEINGKQRQSAKTVTKTILAIVIAMLFVFVTLFLLFNFVCPTNPTGSDASYALSSSTTYYKSGSSFYTRSSATYYKCTNSSHSGTNKYSSSSDLSGTCYTRSGTCSTCNGSGSRTKSTYHSCSKTENVTCSTCGGSKSVSVACSNSSCSGGYVSSTCGTCSGSGQVTCDACKGKGYTTYKSSSEWWDEDHGCSSCGGSGATSVWGGGNLVKGTGKVNCSSCSGSGTKRSTCGTCGGSGSLSQSCSTCSATGSVSQTCSTCSGKGYYYTYSTVSCPTTQTNYYDHSVSSYVEYTYTDIDTGSTTTTTTSYSTATGYTVSFNANGGNGSMASQYFLHSHSQTLNANTFTRENYKFKGWATSSTGAVTYSNQQALNLSSGSNMTLYASWELQQFTITLDNQGATTAGSTSVTATFGAAMPNITVPAKTGYTFGGYYTSTGGSGTQYYTASGASAKTCDLTSATTLYAKWTANTYTVAYNANGGTGTTASSTHTYDTAKNLTANGFSRPGYTFSGWATSAGGAKVYDNSASVTNLTATNGATVTLYACWSSNTYNISVDLKGGSGASGTNYTVSTSSQTRTIATPSRTGYTFSSWSISCAGGNPTISGTTLTIPAGCYGEIAMTAVWTPITYTIQYNSNDVSGATASSSHTYDVAKNLTANSFVRTGYTFKGWATSTYGAVVYNNNHSVKNLATTQGATVNLYAVWEAVTVTLTFSAQGANNFGTVMLDVTYDSALPTIIIPTRTGYLFKGYYVGSDKIFDETGHPVPAKSTFTTDTTLTASFLRWFEVVSVTGASTTYTVYDNADADIRNSILTFQPAEGYVITSFSFDNVTWYDIEKCEQTLLNTSAAVGVTYCASTGGRALAIEFRGIFTHDVKIYLRTAAGEYTDLSVK